MALTIGEANAKLAGILEECRAGFAARVVNAQDGYYVEFKRGDDTVWRRVPSEWLDDARPGQLGRMRSLIQQIRRALDIPGD